MEGLSYGFRRRGGELYCVLSAEPTDVVAVLDEAVLDEALNVMRRVLSDDEFDFNSDGQGSHWLSDESCMSRLHNEFESVGMELGDFNEVDVDAQEYDFDTEDDESFGSPDEPEDDDWE